MLYTRRTILRQGSLAGLVASVAPLSLLTGCTPSHFRSGVRVFFAGSWLFLPCDKDATRMYAVAFNPAEPNALPGSQGRTCDSTMPHKVVHGPWKRTSTFDDCSPELDANSKAYPSNPIPYHVDIAGRWNPPPTIQDVFKQACSTSRLTFLKNTNGWTLDHENPTVRVISVPLPTRMIPAAFRTQATITDNGHMNPSCGRDRGVATTHILEYEGATTLTFLPPGATQTSTLPASTQDDADYHFHAIPRTHCLDSGHDVKMFKYLLQMIGSFPCNDLVFNPDDGSVKPAPGLRVPKSVSPWELEISIPVHGECPKYIDLATCGSGGAALGPG